MERVVVWIIARHDAADDFPPASAGSREEQGGIAVLVKGMPFAIEERFALNNQGWDPCRVIAIDPPGEFDERIALPAPGYLRDFNLRHGKVFDLRCFALRVHELKQRLQSSFPIPEQINQQKIKQGQLEPEVPNRLANKQK